MFPDIQAKPSPTDTDYDRLSSEFVGATRSQLSTLTGEIALRNRVIQENDAYVYGDLLERMIDVPIGHDKTPVNWLRRTVEIHRNQMMNKGFQITSAYREVDTSQSDDPTQQQYLELENTHRKAAAEVRRRLIEAIRRDNMDDALWSRMSENASATGSSVLKAFYDSTAKKYILSMVEAVEHIYAIWNRDDFRSYDAIAYVYQVSKQEAKNLYDVGEDVATSPLGMPLAVLSSANTISYISTQPMVTIMEIQGKIQGWRSKNGVIERCDLGEETEVNAVIVGHRLYKLIDDKKNMPRYYIFPNKLVRRRPWGLPDITKAAVNINVTYVETLSDWRTVANKVNFPKFKGFGFGPGAKIPKPKSRTVEVLPLAPGQDVQPLEQPRSSLSGETDFLRQLGELKEQYVREVGISQVLFDNPDIDMNSKQAMNQAMGSISDTVDAKRQLWTPLIEKVFQDALETLAEWDEDIKQSINIENDDWYLKITWPSAMAVEDPAYQAMLMNRWNANTISLQSFLEKMGEGKEEIDRIKDELKDKMIAVLHGHQVGLLAELGIMPPPSMAPPKVNVNLRGDVTPGQEANLGAMHGFNNGPVTGPTQGPQGEQGIRATDDYVNQGMITGQGYNTGLPIQRDASGQPIPIQNPNNAAVPPPAQASGPTTQPDNPQMLATGANSAPGVQPMSQPGSGAAPTSAAGKARQATQRRGG